MKSCLQWIYSSVPEKINFYNYFNRMKNLHKFAILIFILKHHTSWKSSSEKRNPLQHTYINSRWELRDATSQMIQPPSGYSSKVWRMPIVWWLTSMTKDHKHSVMLCPKLRSLMMYSKQQTTIIIPPSTVNMMSNDEDWIPVTVPGTKTYSKKLP